MNIFNKKQIKGVAEQIRSSFEKIKLDMSNILDWLDYFHKKHEEHDIRIKLIENQISYMPKSHLEVKQIIDSYYSYDYVLERVKKLHSKVDNILDSHSNILNSQKPIIKRIENVESSLSKSNPNQDLYMKLRELHSRLEQIERKAVIGTQDQAFQRSQIKEKIVQDVTKNSKNYVKNKILSLMQKYDRITGLQLKEIIVNEMGLCSKSSFYRILAEIETEYPITLTRVGKEKHYGSGIMNQN